MTIKHIKLTNFCGLSPIDQDLPAICLVQGKNEEGKSSFLRSILYLWEKGHDDANITVGADKAEIVATMEDGLQVRALLTRGVGTERMTKKPGAKKWTTTRAEIDSLVNGIGYNPLEFMGMKPKEQLALLLKLMPVAIAPEEMIDALKPIHGLSKELATKLSVIGSKVEDPLSTIAAMRATIYDERTGIKRAADSQKNHADELEASLGPVTEEKDWGVEVARLEVELNADTEKRNDARDTMREAVDTVKAQAQATYEGEVAEALKRRDAIVDAVRKEANEKWAAILPAMEAESERITVALATARERDRLTASHQATRGAVQVAKQSAAQMVKQSAALTEAIKNLDTLQATVAERLPIPGIRFVNGELHNEAGVPFSRWNTATQTFFCLRLAILMKAGFIILDRGLEVLDPDNQKAFLERAQQLAAEEKMQFFVASITKTPGLSIGAGDA